MAKVLARVFAAVGLMLAVVASAALLRSAEFHNYTVAITEDAKGVLQVAKDPYFGKFEIDYAYGTNWSFTNSTDETIVVQIVENHSGTCHVRFSPAGSIFCESQPITIAPKASAQLGATAEDMGIFEYWPFASYTGDLRVGRQGEVLVPMDPEIEIERDFGTFKILVALLGAVLAAVGYVLSRRGS